MDLDKVIIMLLTFDEDELSNEVVKQIIEYCEEYDDDEYFEDDIIDDAFEVIDNWSAEQGLLSILVETVIEKLEEKDIKIR